MSTITYEAGDATVAKTPVAVPRRKNWFARALARVAEARQRQAMNEIRRYGIVLPRELESAGWKVSERSEDSLPFQR